MKMKVKSHEILSFTLTSNVFKWFVYSALLACENVKFFFLNQKKFSWKRCLQWCDISIYAVANDEYKKQPCLPSDVLHVSSWWDVLLAVLYICTLPFPGERVLAKNFQQYTRMDQRWIR